MCVWPGTPDLACPNPSLATRCGRFSAPSVSWQGLSPCVTGPCQAPWLSPHCHVTSAPLTKTVTKSNISRLQILWSARTSRTESSGVGHCASLTLRSSTGTTKDFSVPPAGPEADQGLSGKIIAGERCGLAERQRLFGRQKGGAGVIVVASLPASQRPQ